MALTGKRLTEAVRKALRLREEKLQQGERPWDEVAITALIARYNALPVFDDRTDDELLGYDKDGLPSDGDRQVASDAPAKDGTRPA